MKLSEVQYRELAKYCLDLSKYMLIALVLKFFEPEGPTFTQGSFWTILSGLTFAASFATIGLWLLRRIKQ